VFPDRVVTPVVTFDDSVPAAERTAWEKRLLSDLTGSALDVVPADASNSLAVTIHVSVTTEAGKTDAGAVFHAARATANLGLIRIKTTVESGHAAGKTAPEARSKALTRLGRKVYLALTW
jgi:hypothetical protein